MVMKSHSIADLKAHAPRIIREVETGEPCQITRRNTPVAQVIGVRRTKNRTRAGFDPKVVIRTDPCEPALQRSEWGDLYPG